MGDDVGPVSAMPDPDPGLGPGLGADPLRSDPEVLAAIAAEAGLRRIHFVAWRDLDDPEAGGSELHAHRIASLWAAAGLDVTFRTSAVPDAPVALTRDGYRVLRQAGRYAVFPGAAWEGIRMGHRPGDALVEIWNGMPFLSPLWYRGPRIVFLHHVHAEMWGMALPPLLARMGDLAERRFAPRFYRSSRIVTLSESSRTEIVDMLGFRADRVTVAPPGVDARYSAGRPALADTAGGGGGPARAGEALRRPVAGPGQGEDGPARSAGRHHRRGVRAPGPGGAARRARCHGMGQPPRTGGRRRSGVVVPEGLARGEQLTARGVGHDADGGGGMRDARGGDRHRRAHRRGDRRGVRGSSWTAWTTSRPPSAGCWATRSCAAAWLGVRSAGRAGSPGTRRPDGRSRRWRRRRRRRPRAERSQACRGIFRPALHCGGSEAG